MHYLLFLLETLAGVSIIRAYKRVGTFVKENEHKLNENAKAYFTLFASNRWYDIILISFNNDSNNN